MISYSTVDVGGALVYLTTCCLEESSRFSLYLIRYEDENSQVTRTVRMDRRPDPRRSLVRRRNAAYRSSKMTLHIGFRNPTTSSLFTKRNATRHSLRSVRYSPSNNRVVSTSSSWVHRSERVTAIEAQTGTYPSGRDTTLTKHNPLLLPSSNFRTPLLQHSDEEW